MGRIIDGKWVDQWYDTGSTGGEFKRQDSFFRDWITADGAAGSGGRPGYPAEADRYHLYVSLACPWAHRTLIFRKLKRLEEIISVSVVKPLMLENGWEFDPGGDAVGGNDYLYQVYLDAAPDYQGRVTVPVLWDKHRGRIVNNESAEIIRMFNDAFNSLTGDRQDFYPQPLRGRIDTVNDRVYHCINNGVYRAGFATSQRAYESAYKDLFEALDWVEEILSDQPYLAGERITEADWRLFTTLLRFDAVYHGHFKCNRQRLVEFPRIDAYLRGLYQWPGVSDTVSFNHIKTHYYGSHKTLNPSGIIPAGPALDFSRPRHGGVEKRAQQRINAK